MTRFCTELASVCWQSGWLGFSRDDFSFFFLPFQQGVAVAFFFCDWCDDDKGLRVSSLACTGFRLVDCEKMLFMGEWWHVYWACQINRSNELSQDKNNTHADRDGGDRDRDMFWESAWSRNCASIKHWSLCHLGLFRRPAEFFDVRAVGRVCGLNFTYPALQTGIHRKKTLNLQI